MNNKLDAIKKVAIYTRVSTEDQAEKGFSLEDQLERLRHFVLSQEGWEIQGEYIDEGYSGRNIKRPKYKNMFENMSYWDSIIVYKMDRIHRNSKNFMEMMDHLKKHGKDFVSATESLDTSNAMGRFVMDIIQRIAQLESEQIGERTYAGMTRKAIELLKKFNDPLFRKKTLGCNIAFGYARNNGDIIEDTEKLQLVKDAFLLYSEGNSINKICKQLGLKYCSVQYWLKNPFYVGYAHYINLLWKHPLNPAVTIDLWNSVQVKRTNASTGTVKGQKPLVFDELVDHRILSEKELKNYGLSRHKTKHNFIEIEEA